MKTLIAVVSCKARPMYRDAIRDTWLPLVPADKADVRFFVGKGSADGSADVVELDCGDGYESLPEKVRAIVRWAKDNGYSYTLKCDDDVVLYPAKLLNSGYDAYDFVGHKNNSHDDPVPPYGFCYWMSYKAMSIVAYSELPKDNFDEGWVRTKLYEHGIVLHHDPRYCLHFGRKADFVPKRRPPRMPMRLEVLPEMPVEGTFAWCLYIPWLGYKNLPHERNLKEFKKVFEANCK